MGLDAFMDSEAANDQGKKQNNRQNDSDANDEVQNIFESEDTNAAAKKQKGSKMHRSQGQKSKNKK